MSKLYLPDLVGINPNDMPIGSTARVYHQHCNTTHKDATITRTPPGWVMHCFKCGLSGFHYARVAPKSASTAPMKLHTRNYDVKAVRLDIRNDWHLRALDSLGLLSWYHPGIEYYIDEDHGRLFFQLSSISHDELGELVIAPHGWVGKAYTTAKPKWLVVEKEGPMPIEYGLIYLAHSKAGGARCVVVVEDPISALKIREAHTDVAAIAMLGLQLPPTVLEYVVKIKDGVDVVLWPDGDAPGIERGSKLYGQLKFLRPSTKFTMVRDKDPKDLTMDEIRRHLDCVRKEVSIRPRDMEAVPSAHEGRCAVEGAAVSAATS